MSCVSCFAPCVSCRVTSRHVTSDHVTSRHVTARRVTARHVTSRHGRQMSCRVESCCVASWRVGSRRGALHHVVFKLSCVVSVMSCHIISWHATSCHPVDRGGGFEPLGRRKPPGSWENRCRKSWIPLCVRFRPFPKFPRNFRSLGNFGPWAPKRLSFVQRNRPVPTITHAESLPWLQNFPEISGPFIFLIMPKKKSPFKRFIF